ncbi:MAG: 4-(cytidine 5'-diphospho)-2-C-methyl-D-erythritol kinase [bacterium]|jgi:4-diphosphocytidyl-2-C-methyl-D-erythritol kinase
MVVFPNAKINLGLRVTSKRDDGYHNLDTVFYPIPILDALEIVTNSLPNSPSDTFSQTGKTIPGDKHSNLCIKALNLLRTDFPQIPSVLVHLHKNIPMGAGMGGGSSDGAFMLSLLNQKYKLGIAKEQLMQYALKLGSDCPFFIENKPVSATGRGELMKPISLDLSQYSMLIVSPGIHISTAEAFSNIALSQEDISCEEIVQQPIAEWRSRLVNDFEKTVFPRHPELSMIKEQLYNIGALYASMTGTGSTLYGIFEKRPETSLLESHPYEISLIEKGKEIKNSIK